MVPSGAMVQDWASVALQPQISTGLPLVVEDWLSSTHRPVPAPAVIGPVRGDGGATVLPG
jgi:hypothetical protein